MQNIDLYALYKTLLKKYGRQNWWPVSARSPDPFFEICIGAILTQNTAWKNVEKAIGSMLAAKLMSPAAVAKCPTRRLQQCIRSSGYYKQKAKKLKIFSKWLAKNYKQFCILSAVDRRQRLLALWGIGPETADSILLYACKKPIFVIDTYTKRFLSQYGARFKTYDGYQKFFMDRLPKKVKLFNEYHALIVKWGKDNPVKD